LKLELAEIRTGAIVTREAAPFAIVPGLPARLIRWRSDFEQDTKKCTTIKEL
jgi:acetyltransferase-like isoleucine patch superfamily enzyme